MLPPRTPPRTPSPHALGLTERTFLAKNVLRFKPRRHRWERGREQSIYGADVHKGVRAMMEP